MADSRCYKLDMRRDEIVRVELDRDGESVEVEVVVEFHHHLGGWAAAADPQGLQHGAYVDLTYAEQHDAEQLALREHGDDA